MNIHEQYKRMMADVRRINENKADPDGKQFIIIRARRKKLWDYSAEELHMNYILGTDPFDQK